MASSGRRIDFSSVQRIRMEKKEEARKRWQRKISRQVKGSNNRKKS
jgi:putative transposase